MSDRADTESSKPAALHTFVTDETVLHPGETPGKQWRRPTQPDPSKDFDEEYFDDDRYDAHEAAVARDSGAWG